MTSIIMGYPMAGHLRKKGGHDVTVYNRTPANGAAQSWHHDPHRNPAKPTARESRCSSLYPGCWRYSATEIIRREPVSHRMHFMAL